MTRFFCDRVDQDLAPAPFQNESEQFISSNRATTGALDPHHANSLGISVVYQELSLCPNLSAAENIALHQAADTNFLHRVDRKQLNLSAQELLCRLGLLNLDVTEPIRSFNLGQRQLVEIAKALTTRLRVLFRDEPNSALTSDESAHLFRAVRELRQQGIAIVYVSHRLEERCSSPIE